MVAVAGFSMNVVVEVVVFALLRELTPEKEDGRLTSVPVCPLVTDNGSWMSSCCP